MNLSESTPSTSTLSDLRDSSSSALIKDESSSVQLETIAIHKRIPNKRLSVKLSNEFSLASLNFSRHGLYGRQEEIKLLKHVYEQHPQKALVLLSGQSGSGKTALALTLRKTVQHSPQGMFAMCKFDLLQMEHPLAGICNLLTDVCRQILRLDPNYESDEEEDSGSQSTSISSSTLFSSNQRSGRSKLQVTFETLQTVLKTELEVSELTFLGSFVPKILPIVGLASAATPPEKPTKELADRLHFLLVKVVRILSSKLSLVWFLDDLQWADALSLKLLEHIMRDADNQIIVLACYRSNSVSETLSQFIETFDDASSKKTAEKEAEEAVKKVPSFLQVHTCSVGDLTVRDLQIFLVDLLSRDEEEVLELAELLHQKTKGNPFYAKQALLTLQKKKILHFNIGLMKWTWDTAEARANLMATANVVELVQQKLGSVQAARQILPLAACLGSTFHASILELVWNAIRRETDKVWADFYQSLGLGGTMDDEDEDVNEDEDEETKMERNSKVQTEGSEMSEASTTTGSCGGEEDAPKVVEETMQNDSVDEKEEKNSAKESALVRYLKTCVQEEFLEQVDKTKQNYRFLHDRIQEGALTVISSQGEKKLAKLKFRIGMILWMSLPPESLDSLLFMIIGLIDEGISDLPKQDPRTSEIVRLQFQAGKKAMSCSAFSSACKYFAKAVSLVPDLSANPFCVDLLSSAAEAEFCVGEFENCLEYCRIIYELPSVKLFDQLRAYHIQMDTFIATAKYPKALEVERELLSRYAIKFPKRKAQINLAAVAVLLKLKMNKKVRNVSLIQSLPINNDPEQLMIIKTMERMVEATFNAGEHSLFALVVWRMIEWTFKNGLTIMAPSVFSLAGGLCVLALEDIEGGLAFAEIALMLLEKLEVKFLESRVKHVIYTYIWNWAHPYSKALTGHFEAYEAGLSTGYTPPSFHSLYFYNETMLFCGTSLAAIEQNMSMYIQQMQDYSQHAIHALMIIPFQIVKNLRRSGGVNVNTTILTGEAMNQEEYLKMFQDNMMGMCFLQKARIYLCLYFGDFKLGTKVGLEWADKVRETIPGQPHIPITVFATAVMCLVEARKPGNKKLEKEGLKQAKLIKKWASREGINNPNCVHMSVLLDALVMCLKRNKRNTAYQLFESAVLMSGRRGITNDQALANEMYFLYAMEQDDRGEAEYRLKLAFDLYQDWGAKSKLDVLCEAYKDEFPGLLQP